MQTNDKRSSLSREVHRNKTDNTVVRDLLSQRAISA
jgi:hypothetical protein